MNAVWVLYADSSEIQAQPKFGLLHNHPHHLSMKYRCCSMEFLREPAKHEALRRVDSEVY